MRPIKFRAWYKNEKLMLPIAEITFHKDWDIIAFPLTREAISSYLVWGNVVLMQSTWLEDKNGDEIFRGDIVIFEYYWPTYIWEVSSNEFFHSCIKVWEKEFHIDNAMIWEVIGNIYENPELLSQK